MNEIGKSLIALSLISGSAFAQTPPVDAQIEANAEKKTARELCENFHANTHGEHADSAETEKCLQSCIKRVEKLNQGDHQEGPLHLDPSHLKLHVTFP